MTEEERKKGLNHMREVRRKVQEKWENLGLLDGLEYDDLNKPNLARMLEGEASQMVGENQTGDTKSFDQIHIPLAIHVAKQLSGNTIA